MIRWTTPWLARTLRASTSSNKAPLNGSFSPWSSRSSWPFYTRWGIDQANLLRTRHARQIHKSAGLLQVWIAPGTGLATPLTRGIESFSPNSEATMVIIFGAFALLHSGLAYLRPLGTLCITSLNTVCWQLVAFSGNFRAY